MEFPRGAVPTSRYKLAAAVPFTLVGIIPVQFIWPYVGLSMWGNDVDGDCVSAEEAAAKACRTLNGGVFITEAEVIAWAKKYGFLNGADIYSVTQKMLNNGFKQGSYQYDDGNSASVDWTNASILQNAITMGPVKIGIAADQIQKTYNTVNPATGGTSGWFATGYKEDDNEDHCVHLSGYGPISWLSQQIEILCKQLGLVFASLPAGVDGTQPGYAIFTWKSVGIIDVPSLLAITGEAWVRNPTTVAVPITPTPPPVPPIPVPVTIYNIVASAGAGGSIYPSGTVAVKAGANQNFSIAPTSGYQVASVLVDGISVGDVTTFGFTSVQSNHTIMASFTKVAPTPSASEPLAQAISDYLIECNLHAQGAPIWTPPVKKNE